MYPCSNPELVAAVSAAGGIGVVQPLSMIYVYGHDFRAGLKLIRRLTDKPIGMNVLIERSSKMYLDRMKSWVDVALDEHPNVRLIGRLVDGPDAPLHLGDAVTVTFDATIRMP